ncbi:uncharacterized protein LOC143032806 [Oratosquilla oratoria]|uniref:uncharacterized protein LOC143032806 n=1 Tax=Oratosquilla oratoria TaxID=337810 RepID=UPI003F766A9A
MSTQVSFHRIASTSVIIINTEHLKTLPGLLKVMQVALGCLTVGILGHYIKWTYKSSYDVMLPELFFLLVATTCLITTALLLFSCMFSISTAAMLPKTLFMSVLQGMLAYLLTCCSVNYIRELVARNENYDINEIGYNSKMFAGVIGIINTLLYIISTICSVRSFRRG